MKTRINTLIAICILGVIGITNINAIADNKSLVKAEVATEKEQDLTIESWMTNENYWTSDMNVTTEETESPLSVELWMTNESNWTSANEVENSDNALSVEPWMTNENTWAASNESNDSEKALAVESWMTNESLWK